MNDDDNSILEDEGAGYLVSVSDIMAGLLFVFIITLVAFVIQFQDAADKKKQEQANLEVRVEEFRDASEKKEKEQEFLKEKVEELTNNRSIRKSLLTNIEGMLRERGVEVEVDQELGVLRLTEKTVQFRRNEAVLDETPKRNLSVIAEVLAKLLPCYASRNDEGLIECDRRTTGKLEAVFVEGHTDNVPVKGVPDFNWQLSTRRAIATYQFMVAHEPNLGRLLNGDVKRPQPLFSVAGYAEQRPIIAHDEPTDDARNRRIDIRFIMTPPKETSEIIQAIHNQGVR